MIRPLLTITCAGLLFLTAAPASAETETMKVWKVDTQGKPPFKRTLVEIAVHDVAQLERVGEIQTETVTVTDFRGKPPFRRSVKEVQVVDTASLESFDIEDKPAHRRTFFSKRHR